MDIYLGSIDVPLYIYNFEHGVKLDVRCKANHILSRMIVFIEG